MKQPISHKLAPFLNSLESDFQGAIAGYASMGASVMKTSPLAPLRGIKTETSQVSDLLELAYSNEFDQLLDIFCVDHSSFFNLFYLFNSTRFLESQTLCLHITADTQVPSLSTYYASANWLERECFDLYGIYFEEHPDLRRLLLYPEFAGHPLKKDYPINKAQPLIPIYA
ncbi:MAG: NADH-quinone oxidoreductase subunit C [Myxococcaceae bacterium]